ncbi:MAG: hypothetical protein AB8B78_08880 [Polaribacter sp.]
MHSQKNEVYYLKIIDTTKNKQLKLASLDSLIHNIKNQKDLLKFAERTEQYVDLALELNEFEKAAEYTIRGFFVINTRLGQRERALNLIEKVEKHITKINDSYLLGGLYLKKGGGYYNGKNYEDAVKNYSLAIDNYSDKDSIYKADAIYFRGQAYSFLGKNMKALKDYKLASTYYENLGDIDYMFFTEGSAIMIYSINGLIKKSIEARKQLIKKRYEKNYLKSIDNDYFNLANNYLKIGDSILFEKTILKAIDYNKKNANQFKNLSIYYNHLSMFYANKNDLAKADKYIQLSSNNLKNEEKNTLNKASLNKAKSFYFYKSGAIEKSLQLSLENLEHEKSRNNLAGIRDMNFLLSKIYSKKGSSSKSFKYFKDYISIKDSISTTEKTNSLNYYQTLYETEQNEKKNKQTKNIYKFISQRKRSKKTIDFIWRNRFNIAFSFILLI